LNLGHQVVAVAGFLQSWDAFVEGAGCLATTINEFLE
jgi:hypothetical protein